jgi:hypothetical protein
LWIGLTVAAVLAGSLVVAMAGGPPDDAKYVGPAKCKACHIALHKTWAESKHAKNFSVLQGAEKTNPECVKCHTTGYGKASGFTSEAATPNLENTTCEACHGPASAHVAAALDAPDKGDWDKKINKNPGAACVGCHNPHVDRKAMAESARAAAKGK